MNYDTKQVNKLNVMNEKKIFLEQGFVGPYKTSLSSTFFEELSEKLIAILDDRKKHPIYNRFSVRDWHLVYPEMIDLFKDPAVLGRLQSILGQDLVLWRSKIFDKLPGEGPIGWHQEWGKFNGEEIGNDVPALEIPTNPEGYCNNLTVWFALTDIDHNMGPIRFAKGTNNKRFPIEMVELTKSEFWQNPILEKKPSEIVSMAMENSLILDIDTSDIFSLSDKYTLSKVEIKSRLQKAIKELRGAKTMNFNEEEHNIENLEMKMGEFVIFTERTMHGSSANFSNNRRIGFNGRVTSSNNLIYPGRLTKKYIDGSNLDILNHKCVLLSGNNNNNNNNVLV